MLSPLRWADSAVGVLYQTTPWWMSTRQSLPIRVCPRPGPGHLSGNQGPTPAGSIADLEEWLDSEIGSGNTSAPVIVLLSLTPYPQHLFFLH